ncbi:MAG: formylglycine-generating enzyme family protein [Magnetococcales bacterium]|nr:formylglycine-generating enzyme family protein [Magnetococcales bacterium]
MRWCGPWWALIGLLGVVSWGRAGESRPVVEREFAGMPFVQVPAGCFQMGSPEQEAGRDADEGPRHEVCLDGFWIGRHEVTQGEWLRVMGSNPAHFALSEHHPVEKVSWEQAQLFIGKLNGLGVGTFRLPSEAEWEYVARAGSQTAYAFGMVLDADREANFKRVRAGQTLSLFRGNTLPVESFPANRWGVFDMHGNVSEWVQDWYCEEFYRLLVPRHKNPLCVDDSSGFRVLRGGSWYDEDVHVRSADRGWSTPDNRHVTIGVRLVHAAELEREP